MANNTPPNIPLHAVEARDGKQIHFVPTNSNRSTQLVMLLALAALAVHAWLLFGRGQDGHILIHDNLDSSFVYYELLAQNDALLNIANPQTIDGMLAGLSSHAFGRIWTYRILRRVFDGFTSYQLLLLLQRSVAFLGMFWFVKQSLLRHHSERLAIAVVAATAFGTLPFWPFAGLSIAGLPWVAGIFWQGLTERFRWYHLVSLWFIALSSVLALSWIFFIPLAVLALLTWQFTNNDTLDNIPAAKRFSIRTAWVYLAWFVLCLAATRWIEVVGVFLLDEATIRSEFLREYRNLSGAMRAALSMLLRGQYHAHSLHFIVLPLALMGLIATLWHQRRLPMLFTALAALLLLSASLYGLYIWESVVVLEQNFTALRQFNWSRLHWLTPFFWWILAAWALAELAYVQRRVFVLVLVTTLLWQTGINILYSDPVVSVRRGDPSFRQFFATELFAQVRADMHELHPQGLAVAVGMHPAVLHYNSIHTLDGYLSTAPLSRKRLFERILEEELAKNQVLHAYVDRWGGRLYIFSDDLQRQANHTHPQVYRWREYNLEHLAIRSDVLQEQGVRFIVAALPIGNASELGLRYLQSYSHEDSAWLVRLYTFL